MRRPLLIGILIILVILILFLVWNFLFRGNQRENRLVLFGNVDVRQVEIGFRVFGRVETMFFDEGECVPKGALMAVLEKEPYVDQFKQAEAAAKSSKLTFENSELLLARRKKLAPSGGVSKEDLENAESRKNVDFSNYNEREATLATAKTNLKDTEVFCPNDGMILTRVREPGSVVNVGDPIYTLSILSPVWVRAYVSETDLGRIYPGMMATIYTDAGKEYEGHIGFISPTAEFTPKTVETEQLRTSLVYRIRVIADNPDHYLKQGMPVTVALDLKTEKDAHAK